jgi:SAM-dependent methyltransferase/tetratricopeptide (TPR) repeat protein
MRPQASAKTKKQSWSELGSAAVDAGDLARAEQCFREAIRTDRRNGRHHFHLALVLEARGDFGAAAAHLTQALRFNPADADAARRLTALISRRPLPADVELDPAGMKAALHHDTSASWLVTRLALHCLTAKGSLATAFAVGKREGWLQAARALCLTRTADALKDDLLLEILRTNILRDADAEYLLTAVRCVLLLEAPPERFRDKDLLTFVLTMMHQCRANEHVWYVTEAEEARLASEPLSLATLLDGDVEEGRKFLLALLYKSLPATFGEEVAPEALAKVRPKALRDVVQAYLTEDGDLRARAQTMPKLDVISDEVSRRVAQQYEHNPYPRWTSLRRPPEGEERKRLGAHFSPGQLAFMDSPYDVLIAGCGTGHQAIYAALNSPNARVTAVDLSTSALAYAAKMAERYAIRNVEFLQADILSLPTSARFASRFQIIECLGVLHHMGDPFGSWRLLLDCLAPGGKLLVGLYSATARTVITQLRSDPDFPGPGCDAPALRKFRRNLMDRPPSALGGQLKLGPDFYSSSEFCDLACHVSERCVTLAEIRSFLATNALTFRGFWLNAEQMDQFRRKFPGEPWPGRLELWEEFEASQPHTFAAMYNLWCERA